MARPPSATRLEARPTLPGKPLTGKGSGSGLKPWRPHIAIEAMPAFEGYGEYRGRRAVCIVARYQWMMTRLQPALTEPEWRLLIATTWKCELLDMAEITLAWAKLEELERDGILRAHGYSCGAELVRKLKAMSPLELIAAIDVVERVALLEPGMVARLSFKKQIVHCGGQVLDARKSPGSFV